MKKVIELQNIKRDFQVGEETVHALRGVSFTINEGEFVTIMGTSGSGKSTLLNTLGCLDTPTSGEYLLDDISVRTMSKPQRAVLRNRKIGFVFQSYNLLPKTTAVENVELPLMYNSSVSASERRQRAVEALQAVGLGDRLEHKSNQMSGGQMQRVAIARAVASSPKLLLLDEPLSNLDAKLRIDMRSELQRLHKELGTTIIYVTHDQVEALTMSTKIALFKAGELSQVDAPMDLYMNPIDLEAADFIGNPRINFLEGTGRYENGKLMVKCELSDYTFDKADMTDEPIPKGEFPVVVAIRPEQVHITAAQEPGSLPVKVYANQPAGSETLVSLQAGKSDFLSKQIGLAQYDIDQTVYVHIDPDKINIYDAKSTRLIKRAH